MHAIPLSVEAEALDESFEQGVRNFIVLLAAEARTAFLFPRDIGGKSVLDPKSDLRRRIAVPLHDEKALRDAYFKVLAVLDIETRK